MSSTNDQPALTRRQVRDLERAREAGEAITGSISVVSGSPVPSAMPVTTPSSSQAPSSTSAPASKSAPSSLHAPSSTHAPGSVHAPGSAHTPTRRELRAIRDAEAPLEPTPVPLRAPKPSSARTLSDALSHVADIENGTAHEPPAPREAPRTFTPPPPSPAPAPDMLPAPRSAGRAPLDEAAAAAAPQNEAPAPAAEQGERAPGPRRHGAGAPHASNTVAPPAEPVAAEAPAVAAAPLPPSSTPTVFPFALSGASSAPEAPASVEGETASARAASRPEPTTPAASVPAASVPAASVSVASVPSASVPAASAPVASTPAVAPESGSPASGSPASAAAQAAPAPAEASRPVAQSIPASVPDATPYVPPVGHWSTQADIEDDTIDSVGSHFGTMTGQQNALILGNDSLPDITGALNATGEVIITGSIDLPRSLAATGSHHAQRIDGSDIDRMMEEGDRETAESDATPVRASRAVSANTSTRAVVLAAGKPKTNRLPIIASICGGVVILVIVGLVVAGFVTGTL